MVFESHISFHRALRGVAFVDPSSPRAAVVDAPFPPAPLPAVVLQEKAEAEAIARVLASLAQAAQQIQTGNRQQQEEMARAAVNLAVTIAGRLIHAKLEAGEFGLDALIQKLLSRLEGLHPVTVRLHPEDLALLRRRVPDDQALFPDDRVARMVADPLIGRGSCRADMGDVSILSELDAQLADIRKHLLESLDHGHAEP